MQQRAPDDSPAVRARGLLAWPLRIVRGRLVRERRLLLLVLTVAILASTAVTSVGLLISATESSAIRTSLRALPTSETGMSIDVEQTKLTVAATTARMDDAIRSVVGKDVTTTTTSRAYGPVYPVPTPASARSLGSTSLTYFGELDGVKKHITIDSGQLPTSAPAKPAASGAIVDVAVPDVAATRLGLRIGSTISYAGGTHPVTIRIVGIFTIQHPRSAYWSEDQLNGYGNSPDFGLANGDEQVQADAFGPLLVATGTLDAIGVTADRIQLDYTPDFGRADVTELEPLINRLGNAESDVPSDAGGLADQVSFSGGATVPLGQIASALVVTRSTVVVVTLLLLVLSLAALGQAARLLTDARAGDRELMRARGASGAHILGIAALEAVVVGVVTAVVSAPLARLVYAIIALQPALVSARVPGDAGLPASAWLTSGGLGALFVVVLLLSLVGRSGSFVAAQQSRSRQRRVSGILRSGLDLGIVVIAAVAFWQLSIYRSPVGASTSLSVDPVLVAAPALVLLAGSLLAARLFPLVARLVDAAGDRGGSVLLRLASWEIGRRSQRATAVVLLLTLALAVGTFSETFLSTWRQSQVDQADYAVGPPVRVAAVPAAGGAQRSLLENGASSLPQPVIRRVADVNGDGGGGEDTNAVVLGLTAGARAMLDRGRLASDGGSTVAALIKSSDSGPIGVALPGDPDGIAATAQVGDAAVPFSGVGADVEAVVEDGAGLLSTVDLGTIPVDGTPHAVSGTLATVPSGSKRSLPIRLVGLQVDIDISNQATYRPNPQVDTQFLVRDIASVTSSNSGDETSHPATVAKPLRWNALANTADGATATGTTLTGWPLAVSVSIPSNVQANPAGFATTAWTGEQQVPAVITTALAHTLDIRTGSVIQLNFARASVNAIVVGESALIPGTVDQSQLTPSTAAGADASGAGAIVVDQSALERALVAGGETGSTVDEWWVDVPSDSAAAYVDAHRAASGIVPTRSSAVLALEMQQDPLRVATQAALWLAIAAAALLAAIGFAVHSASTLSARRIELAQLRAIGLSRGRLITLIGAESLLLCALGVLFGVVVGLLLGYLAGPLIALSPNGMPAVPTVRVLVPWLQLLFLVLVVVVVLLAVVAAVARGQRSANPANILREADNG